MASNTTLSADVQKSGSTEEIAVLPEVLETAPEATVSADLQISESPEEAPERSTISGDTRSDVKADNPPPAQEDGAISAAAAEQGMQILRSAIRPYLPLDRRPGKQIFRGIDLVNQSGADKPFRDIGIILMAAQLVKTWEKTVADDLKAKITVIGHSSRPTPRPSALIKPVAKAQEQLKATLPHKPLSQPVAHAWTLPKKQRNFEKHVVIGGGLLFVREGYLRRLELENLVYRQHLHELEESLYEKVYKNISKTIRRKPGQANIKAKAAVKSSAPAVEARANGAKRSSDEAEGSGHDKRPKIGPHHSRSAKEHAAAPTTNVPLTGDHRGADVSDAIVIAED